MSNWTDINRLRLIKAFRKNPGLWSRSHPDYSMVEKRKTILADITQLMNKYETSDVFTVDDVRTQLKNLKDMYRRKIKRMQQMKTVAQKVEEPCWYYFEHLKFLDSAFDRAQSSSPHRRTDDEYSDKCIMDSKKRRQGSYGSREQSFEIKSEITANYDPDYSEAATVPRQNTWMAQGKRPRLENDQQHRNFENDDELSIFGQFVGTTLRKLSQSSPAMAIQVKKQINDLLCDAELEICQLDSEASNISSCNT